MSFTLHLQKITAKAGANADNVVKKIALDVLTSVVSKSPVDTGRFKSNWQLGVGLVDGNTTSPAGDDAISRGAAELVGFKAGKTIFISNSLPYARRLEEGYSTQSLPNALVKLTIIEFRRMIRKAKL